MQTCTHFVAQAEHSILLKELMVSLSNNTFDVSLHGVVSIYEGSSVLSRYICWFHQKL